MRISDWSSDVCSSDLFEVVTAIEAWRAELLDNNPLSSTTQRLVHFGMTLAVGDAPITADHARSAMRAGATLADLHGVSSDERRGGKDGVSTYRTGWSPDQSKKNDNTTEVKHEE